MSNRLSANQWRPFAAFSAALLAMTVAACASRELPASFPSGAPASTVATPAPLAPAAVALAEDPPLPGESTARWPGLAAESPAAAHLDHAHRTPDGGREGGHAH